MRVVAIRIALGTGARLSQPARFHTPAVVGITEVPILDLAHIIVHALKVAVLRVRCTWDIDTGFGCADAITVAGACAQLVGSSIVYPKVIVALRICRTRSPRLGHHRPPVQTLAIVSAVPEPRLAS